MKGYVPQHRLMLSGETKICSRLGYVPTDSVIDENLTCPTFDKKRQCQHFTAQLMEKSGGMDWNAHDADGAPPSTRTKQVSE